MSFIVQVNKTFNTRDWEYTFAVTEKCQHWFTGYYLGENKVDGLSHSHVNVLISNSDIEAQGDENED